MNALPFTVRIPAFLLIFLTAPMVHHTCTPAEKKETVQSVTERLEASVRERLAPRWEAIGFRDFPGQLWMVGLKEERMLEVYAESGGTIKPLVRYPFTAFSGALGPKLREGDLQIPEGMYGVAYLNPNSRFYLSLKVDYPNAFDRRKGVEDGRENLGGDIFIHGKAATIGCIPIGDEAMEELFVMVARAGKENTRILISPRDFRRKPDFPSDVSVPWAGDLYAALQSELQRIPEWPSED